jgi:predicted enzyme related to lactoylglutathione lyase
MSDQPNAGTMCWFEIMTTDGAKVRDFYSEMFGWQWTTMDMGELGTYWMMTPPGAEQPIGGLMEMKGPQWEGVPPHFMNYIAVDDIDAAADKAKSLGATIKVPPTPIPNVGHFCVLADPTGAVFSLYKGAQA